MDFESGSKGIGINLHNDNPAVLLCGSDVAVNEGDIVKPTGRVAEMFVVVFAPFWLTTFPSPSS